MAAPITVVINGPMASMTILSGDGSAILLPRHVGNVYSESVCFRHGLLLPTPLHVQARGRDAPLPRGRLGAGGGQVPSTQKGWEPRRFSGHRVSSEAL